MTARIKSVDRAVIDCTYSGNRIGSGSGAPKSPNIEHVAVYDRPNQVRNRTDSIPKLLERALRTVGDLIVRS